jgi:chromosomal replication initiation ATPase DnaA
MINQAIISLCMIADLSKRQEFDMCIADLPEDIRTEARHIYYSRLSKATIIHDILRIVSEESGIPSDVITSRKRQFNISDARKVVIKLCVKYSDQSYSTIGKFVGRDHATVCQQLKRHDELMQVDGDYVDMYKRCEERVNAL